MATSLIAQNCSFTSFSLLPLSKYIYIYNYYNISSGRRNIGQCRHPCSQSSRFINLVRLGRISQAAPSTLKMFAPLQTETQCERMVILTLIFDKNNIMLQLFKINKYFSSCLFVCHGTQIFSSFYIPSLECTSQ